MSWRRICVAVQQFLSPWELCKPVWSEDIQHRVYYDINQRNLFEKCLQTVQASGASTLSLLAGLQAGDLGTEITSEGLD